MKYINLTLNDVILTCKKGCKIIKSGGYILNPIYKDYTINIDGMIMHQKRIVSCEGMIPDKKEGTILIVPRDLTLIFPERDDFVVPGMPLYFDDGSVAMFIGTVNLE